MPNANPTTDTTGITAIAFRETVERLNADGEPTAKQRVAVLLRTADPAPTTWEDIARILSHTRPAGPCSVRTARTHYQRGVEKIIQAMEGR